MVHAAEADVEGPAVAAEDPNALLVQVILLREDFLGRVAAALFELCDQGLGSGLVLRAVVIGVEPCLGFLVAAWFFAPSS